MSTDLCVYVRHMDLCVPVRHTDFCVYVEGRNKEWRNKEGRQGRKQIILVNYLLQIPFLCICSPEFLIHPWPFIVSFLWNSLFVFEFSESLSLYCILVSWFLFFLSRRNIKCYFLPLFSIYFPPLSVWFSSLHHCGKPWPNFITAVLLFMAN